MTTQWKEVRGSQGAYQVSSDGRVRSRRVRITLVNKMAQTYSGKERVLFQCGPQQKYKAVDLGANIGRKYVHHLMAESFLGWEKKGFERVSFKDNNPDNLCIENIRVVNQAQLNREWRRRKNESTGVRH